MEKLEIIITYDEGQDFLCVPVKEIDLSISLSNWILENINGIVDMKRFNSLFKLSCCLYSDKANKKDLFVQDLIKTNGKFYFNI